MPPKRDRAGTHREGWRPPVEADPAGADAQERVETHEPGDQTGCLRSGDVVRERACRPNEVGAHGKGDTRGNRDPATRLGDGDGEVASPRSAADQPDDRNEMDDAERNDQRNEEPGTARSDGGGDDGRTDRQNGEASQEQEERGGETGTAVHRLVLLEVMVTMPARMPPADVRRHRRASAIGVDG